jgi:hypothetical protein
MIVAGKVRLSFETSEGLLKPGTPRDDHVLIRTLTEPGRVIGWRSSSRITIATRPPRPRTPARSSSNDKWPSAAQRRSPSSASN